MNKTPLSPQDIELVRIATQDIVDKFNKDRHWVASAVRTASGKVHTALNLYADSASLSLCAEPIAIGHAVDKDKDDPVHTVVTVYHERKNAPPGVKVVSPCGRCREIIMAYGKDSWVILREPGTDNLFKVPAAELLPYRYETYRQEGRLY